MSQLYCIIQEKLVEFILASQDDETGGFADRPGDWVSQPPPPPPLSTLLLLLTQVDPFHTLFGLAGLSLLGNDTLKPVNPVFCMPQETIDRLGLKITLLS